MSDELIGKTMAYRDAAGFNRSSTMSSQCRAFRTANTRCGAKLLIAVECATVSEGRHAEILSSLPNNKYKQHKVNAASSCGAKTRGDAAHDDAMEPNVGF